MERSAVKGIFRKLLRGILKTVIALVLLAAVLLAWTAYLNYPPHYHVIPPELPARNAYDDFLRASKARRHIYELEAVQVNWRKSEVKALDLKRLEELKQVCIKGKYRNEALESIQTPLSLQALLKENETALTIIREGLQNPCVMPLDPSSSWDENEKCFRELHSASMDCRHLLEVNAIYHLTDKDRRAAAEALIDLIQFSNLTIPWYEYLREMGYAQLEAVAEELSPAEVRDVVSRLEAIRRCRSSYASVIDREKCYILYRLSAYLTDAEYIRWYSSRVAVGSPPYHPNPLEDRPMYVNQFYAWTVPNWRVPAIADRYLTGCIRASKQPFANHAPFPSRPRDAINWSNFGWAEWDCQYLQWVMWEFQQDSLMLTLALQGYRQEHRQYPARLNDLVTGDWLRELPVDPFTMSDTICYRNQGKTFMLYSRGPDGDDDGGKRVRTYPKEMVCVTCEGDVVYGINKYGEPNSNFGRL